MKCQICRSKSITLADENEGYKRELISLREELSVTTVALKDRTPELLAPLLPHFLIFKVILSTEATHWQCEGQRFKSAMLHHFFAVVPEI